MKRLFYFILLVCTASISFNCQKEVSYALNNPPTGNNANPSPLIATLQGNIVDENGQAAPGVTVQAGNQLATTDADGYFRIIKAALDKNAAMVTAEKAGYFKAVRSFNATQGANHVNIKLIKKTVAGSIDAGSGGAVDLSNGSKVTLESNGVVKASGGLAYSGTVKVYAAYIDPTAGDIAQAIPGSLMADDKDNKRVVLSSYGMMAVELESSAGEKLQIAPGARATLTMPIPSSLQSSAPASIPLWYIDEQKGIWKEEGVAVKNGNNYVGEVKHFSFWNCDIPFEAVTLSFKLQTAKGVSIVHGSVRLTGKVAGSPSQAYSNTDSLGQASGLVPANEPLLLEVLDPCNNSIYNQKIGPFTRNTDLGTITISNLTSPSLVNISGLLKNCSNLPVTDGYVMISSENVTRYVSVNEKGEFETSFMRCPGGSTIAQVIGVDETSQQQGNPVALTVNPVTDAGTITACGTSSTQYINYTIDGTDYSISSAANDSLSAFTYPTLSNPPFSTWINGMKAASNKYISLYFNHDAGPGTYPAISFSVQSADSVQIKQPFNVILSSYPANAGGFYEGTFSGKFTPMNAVLPVHTINGSFRVRRQ